MISALIICYNEEKNIEDCLKSIQWVDELIVIDAYSSDKTVEICNKYTENVYQNSWKGFSDQRLFGLAKINNDWVFSLDADERCTEDLKKEILELIKNNPLENGYLIPRKNYFNKKWIKNGGWYPNYQLKLFRKKSAKLTSRLVHESYEIDGKISRLKNDLIHYSITSITDYANRINKYSSLSAEEKLNNLKISLFSLLIRPFSDFIHKYILQLGFLDGIEGLIISFFHSYTKFLLYIKIWELRKESGNNENI